MVIEPDTPEQAQQTPGIKRMTRRLHLCKLRVGIANLEPRKAKLPTSTKP